MEDENKTPPSEPTPKAKAKKKPKKSAARLVERIEIAHPVSADRDRLADGPHAAVFVHDVESCGATFVVEGPGKGPGKSSSLECPECSATTRIVRVATSDGEGKTVYRDGRHIRGRK